MTEWKQVWIKGDLWDTSIIDFFDAKELKEDFYRVK